MQKPQQTMQEDWEKELEERFMAFHFEFDERQEHDRFTAELRDWTKSFIRQLLASQKKELDQARKVIVQTELEYQKDQIRERYNELILAVTNKFEGETRHQTALRYIQEAEKSSGLSCRP